MDLAGICSSFQSDLDFCPDCGSVLPLPGVQDAVACTRCGFSINVRVLTACADFEGKVVKTSVVFNKLGTAMPLSMEEGPEFQGPVGIFPSQGWNSRLQHWQMDSLPLRHVGSPLRGKRGLLKHQSLGSVTARCL
ncbi:DNA-directed RNA polymerase I subunit RPA12 isoform X1 [Bos mutus]|uniref:DNA-directed RNA polymerase I subunit RPA12 isoform X1 n=1 Tax=Bos javanicus TaxID=9906 RepID=UPI002AA92C09|nr:DNA-directed RNA polymerase I subunit RPA12 isoform X1 [Bos javanicus]